MRSPSVGMRREGSETGMSSPREGAAAGAGGGGTTAGVTEPVAEVDASGPAAVVDEAPFVSVEVAAAAGSTSMADAPSEVEAAGAGADADPGAAAPSLEGAEAAGGDGTTGGGGGAFAASSALILFLISSASFSDNSGMPSLSGPCASLNAAGEGFECGPEG